MRVIIGLNKPKAAKKSVLLSTSALIAAGAMLFSGSAKAVDDFADWDHVAITRGDANVLDTGRGSTTIEQHSMRAVGEAQELHIGTMGNVRIDQNSKDALFVGRVIGDHDDPTQILGQLSADGRVMIIDRNGVFFGEGSRVDAAGVAVTTGNLSDEQIMSGAETFTFDNFGDGEIVLKGNINVTDAGLAAFVSPTVKNSGVVNATMGRVVMASGDKVTLDMYGDGLVEVAVDGDLKNALIENTGTISAQGGKVRLSAATAKDVVDGVVNNAGLVSADSITVDGDKIILSGSLDTQGVDSASISVTGGEVAVEDTGVLKNSGKGGNTYVNSTKKTSFKGKLVGGKNSTNEISGRELALGGDVELGEGSTLSFDPAVLDVGFAEASTFESALNNNGVTVNVEAQDRINVNANINTATQTTNSTLNFKDEDANNNLRVDLNAQIRLGANQTLKGEATEVNVSSAGRIQNGVDVAKSGANVKVAAGTYNGAVKVNKALNLTGANAGKAGNDATRGAESQVLANSPGFLVTADDVTIDGFEIVGGNAGIHVQDASFADLKNNVIRDQFHPGSEGDSFGGLARGDGIYVERSTGTKITGNLIKDFNDDGVHVRHVVDVTISDNDIRDNGNGDQGIAVALATGKTDVTNNFITNARRDGIQLADVSGEIAVTGNQILNSTKAGIGLVNVSGRPAIIDDNTITGAAVGIDVINSRSILIGDDVLSDNSGNNLSDVGIGVQIRNSNRITIQDNNIGAITDGVRFAGGISDNKRLSVYDNDIAAATGIKVEGGINTGSILTIGADDLGNTIVAGGDGVRVDGAIAGGRLRMNGNSIFAGNDGVEISEVGDDAVLALFKNKEIFGYGGSGIRINKMNAATPGGGVVIVGNGTIQGDAGDGITFGNISNANIGIVDNDLIQGQLQGVSFAGTVDSANILIGDDDFDGTPSVITGLTFDGVHFDKTVNNSSVRIGAGSVPVTTVAATTSYTATANRGVEINSGNDGVGFDEAIDKSTLVFLGNDIDAGDNGFELFGAVTDSTATFRANTIKAQNDGIDFDNTVRNTFVNVGAGDGYAGNTITSGQSGVEFGKPPLAGSIIDNVEITVNDNTIDAGVNGFALDGNANDTQVTITGNSLTGQQRGISVAGGDLTNGTSFDISDNSLIKGVTRDGILIQDLVYGGATATIADNTDISGGDDVVDLRNIEGGTITNNFIHDAPRNGIHLRGSRNFDVIENSVLNNQTGLLLVDTSAIDVRFNNFANNLLYGMHADGTANGDVTLVGNTFLDNPVGARFESGAIDLSDIANPNDFIISNGYNPGITPLVGTQFDGASTLLTIVNETMGGTIFEGYGSRDVGSAYYVRFEDGSILNTATNLPILIDGEFASWDGVVPNDFGGILTAPQLLAIEDRLFDADDAVVDGRGQIFVGRVNNGNPDPEGPTGFLGDFSDFFRDFELPETQFNQASLRVLGLPPISLPAAGLNVANLNNLAPQAGEDNTAQSVANIEPQAGEDSSAQPQDQNVADVEPQAGDQDQQVTCWGDALNSLEAGSVTYNFGGTYEDSIAAETACRSSAEQI